MNKGHVQPCNRDRTTKGLKIYGKIFNFINNQRCSNKMRLY